MSKLDNADLTSELETLKNKLCYLENIIWQLPEQFYWLDLNGRVVACNENLPKLYGMTHEEFIGKNIFDLAAHMGWSEETAQKIRQNDIDVIESGKPVAADEQGEVVGGLKTFRSHKYPLYDAQNKILGVVGMSVDITERKKIEKDLIEQKQRAEAANQAKSNFLMNLSHDIRTPFTGIIGNADILLCQEKDEQKREMLNEIIDSSQYLLDLLNDIINIADREDSQQALPLDRFELPDSIKAIVNLMQLQVLQKQLYLKVNLPDNLPKYIISNRKCIERIVLNLLGNAIKFTEKGGIELTVECLKRNEENVTLQIRIKDTGIGIAQDQIDILFDRSSASTPTYKENYQRCGLGLSIVKGLVTQLNGKIEVESNSTQGTTFQITLECPIATELSHA